MQQLTLFPNQTARLRSGRQNRSSKQRSAATRRALPDLWTPIADVEREMALFFLDIRNFTPFAERHAASNVIHLVKKLFSSFQNIIRIHHGKIIETTGDGFYAAFGFSTDVKTAMNEAVRAGMAILQSLRKLNANSFEKKLHHEIEVGIGIHAGKVATGKLMLGTEEHAVVMGHAVNVASRIQAATKDVNNNFLISATVYENLDYRMPDPRNARLTLKGLTDPVDVFLLGKQYE